MNNYKLNTDVKWCYMFDLHLPYQSLKNIRAAIKWAKKRKLKHLVLGGDVFDFLAISKYTSLSRKTLKREVTQGIRILNEILSNFNEVVYIMGNHEQRLPKYLIKNSPEIFDVVPSTCAAVEFYLNKCGFKHKNIKYIECLTRRGKFSPVKFGKLNIFHLHELGIHSSKNCCEKVFNKIGDHALFGHSHRVETIYKRKADGSVFIIINAGTAQEYSFMPQNDWVFSLGMIERLHRNGCFKVTQQVIIGGIEY